MVDRESGFTPDGHLVDTNGGPLTRTSGFTPDGHLVDTNGGCLTSVGWLSHESDGTRCYRAVSITYSAI